MSKLKICRICLRTEAKVFHFDQYLLKNYYEEIMAYELEDMDCLPRYFCYECATLLHKFYKFKEKCCKAEKLFQEMLFKGNITYGSVKKIDRKAEMLISSLTIIDDNSRVKTYIFKDSKEYISGLENNVTKTEPDSISETSLIDNDDNLSDGHEENIDLQIVKKENITLVDEEKIANDNKKAKVMKTKSQRNTKINNRRKKVVSVKCENIKDSFETDDKNIIKTVDEEIVENDKEKKTCEDENNVSVVYIESKNPIECEEINDSNSEKTNHTVKVAALQNTKNWKITVLSEEEAMKEFKATAESKKYLDAAYKCSDCLRGFSQKDMLDRHVQLSHIEQLGSFECHFCRYRYKQECYKKKHMKQHYYRYKCLKCEFTCPLESTALFHDEYHSGITRKCKYCNEEYRHSSTYYTHLRTHRSEHVCTLCGASFVSSKGLHQHKIRKHVIIEIESPDDDEDVNTFCKRCDIRFETRKAYEAHLFHSALHSDEEGKKDEKIDDDSESSDSSEGVSPSKKLLKKREQAKITKALNKRKTVDDPLNSNMPRKRYKKKERRQKTKPTTCYQCGMHFETQAACLKHHTKAHPGTSFCPPGQRYICEICGSSLARLFIETHTLILHICEICGTLDDVQHLLVDCVKYRRQRELLVCKYKLNRYDVVPGSIATHQNIHTRQKVHTCDTCGKQFHAVIGLKRHQVTHTGEKPYACPLCDKRFTQSNSMKLHYRTFHLKQPYPKRNRQRKPEPKESLEGENSGSETSSDESLHHKEPPRDSVIESVTDVVPQRAEDTIHYLTFN